MLIFWPLYFALKMCQLLSAFTALLRENIPWSVLCLTSDLAGTKYPATMLQLPWMSLGGADAALMLPGGFLREATAECF